MSYALHPEAAMEYAEQVAHYKSLRESLGKCFHAAVKAAASKASAAPYRYIMSNIRQPFAGFP
jgi:hypothetical protein